MDAERWEQVQEVYGKASELAGEERRRYLDEACADDPDLRAEVERMLAQEDGPEDFLTAPAPAVAGRRVATFELQRELGRGGMGVVYEARDPKLERTVALKVLPPGLQTTQRQIDRFQREARSAARLKHPAIVPIYEVGEDRGLHYFSMEHVAGGDLSQELKRQRRGERSLFPAPGSPDHVASVARVVAEVAEALQHSHDLGVVHRDIKPQNLLLGPGPHLRLVDFGLAKDESQGSLTRTGEVAGTPHYMSPEQAAAKKHTVDHRTDIYSLGVVLFEMLTLERPFSGDSAQEVITKIALEEPRSVRKLNGRVPRDMETICAKAMAKDPRERYADAHAFAQDLRHLLALEAIEARPPSLLRRVQRELTRHRGRYFAAGLVVGVALAAWLIAGTLARGRAIDRELLACADLEARGEWLSAPLDERVLLQGRIARLLAMPGLSGAERRRVEALDARMSEHLDELIGEAARLNAAGYSTPAGIETFDDTLIAQGQQRYVEAITLFDDAARARGASIVEATRTRLHVTAEDPSGAPLTGEVFVREIDPILGLPGDLEPIGPLPVEDHPVRPGYYRFIVVPDGSLHRPFTRLVERGMTALEIRCVVDPERDPLERMVVVDGGEMRLPGDAGVSNNPCQGVAVVVQGFLIDEAQVSVGEYLAFIRATGRERPAFWRPLVGAPEDPWQELESGRRDDLPMVGVSWYEARDYAEWAGKRLVSAPERDFAGRGPNGRLYPYALDPGEEPRGAVNGTAFSVSMITGPLTPDSFRAGMANHYLASAFPVRSFPEARSDGHGLFHLLGNVAEWTETLASNLEGSVHVCDPGGRVILGEPWYAIELGATLEARAIGGPGDSYATIDRGFRCARSLRP